MAVLLAVVTVVAVVVGLAGIVVPRAVGYSDGSTATDRSDAISRASDFAVAMNTYDVAKLDDYRSRVSSLLTTSYDKEFTQATQLLEAVKAKKQVSKNAKVLSVAVQTIDSDSADVLVAVDADVTNTDSDGSIPRRFRWKISLVKSGSTWKVDGNESVATLSAETTDPVPSGTATSGTKKETK